MELSVCPCGKSTLVRCLNYLEKPTAGVVKIHGKDLSTLKGRQLRKERQKIAMIFQHFNLLMQKNVLDNICFPLVIAGVSKKQAKKRAVELLQIVGLADKAKAYRDNCPVDRSSVWQLPEH